MATGDKALASRFNAIVNNINTVQAYSGYKQLDYIQTTGNQYIDTDIVVFDQSVFTIETTCAFSNFNTYNHLWSNTAGKEQFQMYANSSKKLRYKWGSTTAVEGSSTLDTNKHIYKFEKNGNTEKMYVDGTQTGSGTKSSTESSKLRLFTAPGKNYYSKAKFYGIKIYVNGTLTYDLVPAKRIVDNVLGLFDLKKTKFYANNGTGVFTAGSETGTIKVPGGQTWQGTVKAGDKMTAASVNLLISNVKALSNAIETLVGDVSSCATNNCNGNHSGYTASSNSHSSSCACNGRCDSDQHYCPGAH